MRKLLILFALLIAPVWASAAPVVVPSARTASGDVATVLPVITVDTTGAYIAPGGAAYTGPLAAQLPPALGAQTGANSLSVVPNSNTSFPVTDAGGSFTVDTGTPGTFTIGNTTFAATQSGTWNINNISGTVSLPTGAATATNQTTNTTAVNTVNTTLGTPFQAGGSIGNTSFAATQSGTWNINNISGTVSLPTGAATATNQTNLSAQFPTTLGQKTAANSLSVAWASDVVGTAGSPATTVVSVQGVTSGTALTVQGGLANLSTSATNPFVTAGRYNTTTPTYTNTQVGEVQIGTRGSLNATLMLTNSTSAVGATGNMVDGQSNSPNALNSASYGLVFNSSSLWDRARGDVNGTVNQPYAMAGSRWNYAAAAGGITNTTTAVTIASAAGASTRNYLVAIQITCAPLGAATEFAVRDGAGGTVLWRSYFGTAGGTTVVTFPAPLRGTANTLMEVVTLTATITGACYVNGQGFTSTV